VVLSNVLLNAAADGLKNGYTHVGLLNSGTELTGGSPAYARKTLSYGATAAGDWAGTATFDVPAGSTVNQVGYYTASSGGAPVHTETVTTEVYGAQGTYALTVNADVD
jgi:hypothetical protein